ncbi:Cobyric acid synthase [Candidatus Hodgkinia cicadicola]|uniref:Cobyric acid synthase n=1 Tax=Candidatus Hodgkinia cicadicola TaxID=573658 RepID=A0ABX4MFT2_9HYPH|nr:Cobyric acid synthase [Candidatus Hodgkinia cicadicola]
MVRCKFTYPGTRKLRTRMRIKIIDKINHLKHQNDVVVVEGAGSVIEANLTAFDVNNIWLARRTSSKVSLIADMERGGALTSIIGVHCLLSEVDRQMIKGFFLNKFVGRSSLLNSGLKGIEQATNWPCLGIIPWIIEASRLPWEDSLFEQYPQRRGKPMAIIIDILFGNGIEELNALNLEVNLNVVVLKMVPNWIPKELKLIILPDSDSIILSVKRLCQTKWDGYLAMARAHGVLIVGIGAGFIAICSRFSWMGRLTLTDLKLFDDNMLCLKVPSYTLNCRCELLSTSFDGCVSMYAPCLWMICNEEKRWKQLIKCNNLCCGVQSSNVWGIGVNGVFINDNFRSKLMQFIGVEPSLVVYKEHVQTTIANAAIKVTECIGNNIYHLFDL